MSGKNRKIRILKEKKKHIPVYMNLAIYFFALICTFFVLYVWLKAWLSFLVPDNRQIWLYVFSALFAAFIWFISYITQKGRLAGLILMSVPCIFAAFRRTFPDFLTVWLQMTAGMIYFMSGIWAVGRKSSEKQEDTKDRKKRYIPYGLNAFIEWMLFAVLILSAAAVCSYMGRFLDTVRSAEGGFYQSARREIKTSLTNKAEKLFSASMEVQEKQELSQQESAMDLVEKEKYSETEREDDTIASAPVISADAMENLNSIASFVPQNVTLEEVILEQPPDGLYYLMENIGLNYTGERWEKAEEFYQEPEGELSDEEYRMLTLYPSELTRMKELCTEWKGDSYTRTDMQIYDCLKEMAVYDTNPGSTPEGKDFAEYFLFENKKGFCVHFATAAALLWRMSGYPAVYVEGYAIPEDAFKKQADGRYQAVIDGSMGHAWCRVYNSDTGTWTDMEYTPDSENAQLPVKDDPQNAVTADGEFGRIVCYLAGALLISACFSCIVILQALIRSRHMAGIIRRNNKKSFIKMYQNLLRTAEFLPEKKQREKKGRQFVETVPEIPENLKLCCLEINEEEWEWMQECILKLLFYELGERPIHRKMMNLYSRIILSAETHMSISKKTVYQFIVCLDPFLLQKKKRIKRKRERKKLKNDTQTERK